LIQWELGVNTSDISMGLLVAGGMSGPRTGGGASFKRKDISQESSLTAIVSTEIIQNERAE
jgi:hypothetical protein